MAEAAVVLDLEDLADQVQAVPHLLQVLPTLLLVPLVEELVGQEEIQAEEEIPEELLVAPVQDSKILNLKRHLQQSFL